MLAIMLFKSASAPAVHTADPGGLCGVVVSKSTLCNLNVATLLKAGDYWTTFFNGYDTQDPPSQ